MTISQLKLMLISILLNIVISKFLKILSIDKVKIFQIKILDELRFCLVIICILDVIRFKVFL